jgi:hypothetical protein
VVGTPPTEAQALDPRHRTTSRRERHRPFCPPRPLIAVRLPRYLTPLKTYPGAGACAITDRAHSASFLFSFGRGAVS